MKSIAVFCASAEGNHPIYRSVAEKVGKAIARKGYTLVYGGGSIGLMGVLASAALENGGKVIGVLPDFLEKRELGMVEVSELIIVESMHERKLKMSELSDGSLTLPGGFGTLEEFFEIITWGQLGLHKKPTALLNVENYYDHLIAHFHHMVKEGLLREEHFNLLMIDDDFERLLFKMENYRPPELTEWMDKEDV
jgi:uncharacterized protein (TIGR00730 family)